MQYWRHYGILNVMDKTPRASRRTASAPRTATAATARPATAATALPATAAPALPPAAPSRPAWAVAKGPEDWIIWHGPRGTGSYTLGPITQGWSDLSAWRCLGVFTSFPQLAIGWATREEALAVIASLHPDTAPRCKVVLRKKAVARFEQVRGGSYELYRDGAADWGTSKG